MADFDYWAYLDSISQGPLPWAGGPGPSLGPDPSQEYTGDSLEDFYDYLLTPRHHMQATHAGAISHYGPSRFASVRPEDAAMADKVFEHMVAQEQRDYQNQLQESDLMRRRLADEILNPQGYGGGTIQPATGFTGLTGTTSEGEPVRGAAGPHTVGTPGGQPPPPRKMDERTRTVLGAGGVKESAIEAAKEQAKIYGARGSRWGQPTPQQIQTDREQAADDLRKAQSAESELYSAAALDPALRGMPPEAMFKEIEKNLDNPDFPQYVKDLYYMWRAESNGFFAAWGVEPPSVFKSPSPAAPEPTPSGGPPQQTPTPIPEGTEVDFQQYLDEYFRQQQQNRPGPPAPTPTPAGPYRG